MFYFFKQKTAYEMSISDWSSDVCSSDLSGASANENCMRLQPPPPAATRPSALRKQQHRVPVGEEPIALAYRVLIGGEDPRLARERRHQHQQRRFGQVEVGQQRVDRADAVAGEAEDPRLAGETIGRATWREKGGHTV